MLIGSIHVAADFAQFFDIAPQYCPNLVFLVLHMNFCISSYMKTLKAFLKSDFLVYVEVEIQ